MDRGRRGVHQASVLEAAAKAGVVVVGRLEDAALRDLPPVLLTAAWSRPTAQVRQEQDQPGQASRATQRLAIGPRHALWPAGDQDLQDVPGDLSPAGGVIRVVLVKEEHGWFAFFCTDPKASVAEILEAFADRATIEQDFHDVKEVWRAGQQQVRNIWTNVAVFQSDLWMHTLVELWAWNRSHDALCDRSDSPWDDADAALLTRIVAKPCALLSCKTNYQPLPPNGGCREKSYDWLNA